jgi:energy-coupling factor transporter transmembrane protein EcfT
VVFPESVVIAAVTETLSFSTRLLNSFMLELIRVMSVMSSVVVCTKLCWSVVNRDDMVSPITPISEDILPISEESLEVRDSSKRWRSLLKTGDEAGMALISAMVASVARAMAAIP